MATQQEILEAMQTLAADVPNKKLHHQYHQVSSECEEESEKESEVKGRREEDQESNENGEGRPRKKRCGNTSKVAKKRTHHAEVRCRMDGCSYFGPNLKRRMNDHVKKHEIEQDEVEQLLAFSNYLTLASKK